MIVKNLLVSLLRSFLEISFLLKPTMFLPIFCAGFPKYIFPGSTVIDLFKQVFIPTITQEPTTLNWWTDEFKAKVAPDIILTCPANAALLQRTISSSRTQSWPMWADDMRMLLFPTIVPTSLIVGRWMVTYSQILFLSPISIIPSETWEIFGGSVRHNAHHNKGNVYYQQFFKYIDDFFGTVEA